MVVYVRSLPSHLSLMSWFCFCNVAHVNLVVQNLDHFSTVKKTNGNKHIKIVVSEVSNVQFQSYNVFCGDLF